MKKEILNSAWEHIEVSDECIGDLLDSLDDVPVITKRPHKKVSYLAIVTAAVVFMCGSIGVAAEAGAFDWIKGFFAPDSITNTEEISDLVGKMDNFKCESKNGTEFSPVGVIYDGSELYAMFKLDKLPEGINKEDIHVREYMINGKNDMELQSDDADDAPNFSSMKCGFSEDDPNNFYVQMGVFTKSGKSIVKNGDKITFNIAYWYDYNDTSHASIPTKDIADVSFDFKEGSYKMLDIDYSKYTCDEIPKRQYDFIFDNVRITPLSLSTSGNGSVYVNAKINDDIRIVFDDGTEITVASEGYGSTYSGDMRKAENLSTVEERVKERGEYHTTSERHFSKPIDPDRIVKVYLGDMCIFKR